MFAVLHIADFALHAVLRNEPTAAIQPAALFANQGKKSLVLAANPAARAYGIEPGMTAPQAVARCPALVVRSPNSEANAEARSALLAVGFTLSPAIEDTAPGICTADLKGSSTAPHARATAAVMQLESLGLPATAGIGRTPLLALYAARAANEAAPEFRPKPLTGLPATEDRNQRRAPAPPLVERSVSPAPLPSDLEPNLWSGVAEASTPYRPTFAGHRRVLTITDEKTFLAPLPLDAADPPAELAAILHTWGLRTLGDLTALPRDEIVRRFGSEGLALWNRAAGGESRPLHPVIPTQHFTAGTAFEQEIETLEPLLFILRRFLDRLTLELQAAQLVASEIELTLRLADESAHARSFRLPEPTADPEIIFRAIHTHLESLQTASAIVGLDLRLTPTRPLVRQHGLFDTGLRDPHGFAETLARVAALVNPDRVGTPRCDDTHRPDAFTLSTPPAVVPPPARPPIHPESGLPLRRFRPPLRATLEFSPTAKKPTYVHTEHFEGTIATIRGPWRSSGDWWQTDRAWSRLEWDIALAEGGLYRLLQIDQAFFIEGEYD